MILHFSLRLVALEESRSCSRRLNDLSQRPRNNRFQSWYVRLQVQLVFAFKLSPAFIYTTVQRGRNLPWSLFVYELSGMVSQVTVWARYILLRVWFLHKNTTVIFASAVCSAEESHGVFSLSLETNKRKYLSYSCTFSRPVLFCTLQTLTPLCSNQTIYSRRRYVRPAGMSDSEWERFASVCLNVLNINHTFRNMIILPWVRRSVLRGNLLRGFGKRFVGILVPHTESAISLADLRPKSRRTYVEHMNPPLLHISFVSRGFLRRSALI